MNASFGSLGSSFEQDRIIPTVAVSWEEPSMNAVYYSDTDDDARSTVTDYEHSEDERSYSTSPNERTPILPGSLPALSAFQKFHKSPSNKIRPPTLNKHEKHLILTRYKPPRLSTVHKWKVTWRSGNYRNKKRRNAVKLKFPSELEKGEAEIKQRACGKCCARFLSPDSKYFRFVVIALVCFMTLGSYVFYDSASSLEQSLQKDQHISDSQLGILYSVYSIPNTIMVFVGGLLVDKLGLRKSVFLFSLLTALGALLFCVGPYFNNYWIMIAGRFLFGVGAESAYVAQDTITAMWFQGKELAMAMGLVGSAGRIGEFFSYAFLAQISTMLGSYRWGFWIACGLCFISLLAAIIFIILDMQAEAYLRKSEEDETEVFSIWDIKKFGLEYWLITLICVTYYSSIFPFQAFCPDYLKSRYGYDEKKAGWITSIISIVPTLTSPILGFLLDKFGHRARAVMGGSFLLVLSYLLLEFIHDTKIIIPCMVMIGTAFSLLSAAIWPCLFFVVEPRMFGTAYGLMSAALNTGNTTAYWASGKLMGNLFWANIFWASLGAAGFLLSIVWNIVDARYEGLANLPSKQTVDAEDGEGENGADEDGDEIVSPLVTPRN